MEACPLPQDLRSRKGCQSKTVPGPGKRDKVLVLSFRRLRELERERGGENDTEVRKEKPPDPRVEEIQLQTQRFPKSLTK